MTRVFEIDDQLACFKHDDDINKLFKLVIFVFSVKLSLLFPITERELAEQRERERELELKRLKEQKERMRAASASPPPAEPKQQVEESQVCISFNSCETDLNTRAN